MHHELTTRKVGFHERWQGHVKERHSEGQGWFSLYNERSGSWARKKVLRFLNLDSSRRAWHTNQLHAMPLYQLQLISITGLLSEMARHVWQLLLKFFLVCCWFHSVTLQSLKRFLSVPAVIRLPPWGFYFLLSLGYFWFNFFVCCSYLWAHAICYSTKMAWW